MERHSGPKNETSRPEKFHKYVILKEKGIDKSRVNEAEYISSMKEDNLRAAFAEAERFEVLNTTKSIMEAAEPFHHLLKRKNKHKDIVRRAKLIKSVSPDGIGQFPLLYADPPWIFETYTPDKTHRMPDDHYPTMSDDAIIEMKIFGRTIPQLAMKDASLFMWCTSSNIERALRVMEGWGFTYKSQLVWDKMKIGLGLIFRNQHEVLLYGDRGDPPKPTVLFSSMATIARTKHSEKPPEIRAMLEKMYPMYDTDTRIELFGRGDIDGWTTFGYEANNKATA